MEIKEECLHSMKLTEKYLTNMILIDDLDANNTEFLKTAYTHLGLYDNQRILEQEKNGIKITSNISWHIYQNIINIIVEEIYEKNNSDILNLFIEYYKQKFTGITDVMKHDSDLELFIKYIKDISGSTRTYLSALYYLLYGKNVKVKKEIICYFEKFSSSYESAAIYQDSGKQLETILKIENVEDVPSYQNFLSRQRKCLTDFIGIKYGKLEKFVLDYFSLSTKMYTDFAEKYKFLYTIKNLYDILERNGIPASSVIKHDEKKCLEVIRWNFKNLCNSMLLIKYCCLRLQNPGTTLEAAIRVTSIEEPQAYLISLFTSFSYELLSVCMKQLLEKDCINFSIDRTTGDKQELLSENYRLKTEIEKMKENMKQKEDAYNKLIREHEKNTKNEIHEYEDQIRSLNRQLEKQKKVNCSLQKKIPEQPCCTENFKEDDKATEDTCGADMDISIFDGKKILFLGGSPAIVNKLKQKFKAACFRDKKSDSFPDKTDIAVILTNYVSHALVNKFRASNKNALIIESNSNNVDKIILQMLKAAA